MTVSIVIVTYNSAGVIAKCLDSLVDNQLVEVIVVDNNSSDDTLDIVARTLPAARIVSNVNNDGFAKAVNRGASIASGEVLLLLNPDCYISSDDVLRLTQHFSDDLVSVVGPVLRDEEHTIRTIAAGHLPTLWRMFTHMSGLSRIARGRTWLEGHYLFPGDVPNGVRQVDWITGGCMFIRKSVWKDLDGLSTRWFMYAEDIDFCWKVKQSQGHVLLDGSVDAIHEVGGSSGKENSRARTLWLTNLYDFVSWRLYPSRCAALAWRIVAVSGFMARSVALRALVMMGPRYAREARTSRAGEFFAYAKALAVGATN